MQRVKSKFQAGSIERIGLIFVHFDTFLMNLTCHSEQKFCPSFDSKEWARFFSEDSPWANGRLGGKFKTYICMRFVILKVRNPLL